MKFEMTDEQFQLLHKLFITPLKRNNAKVFAFGSRAGNKFHQHSDVDILFQLPTNVQLPMGFFSQILENIEESRFHFIVDLVNKKNWLALIIKRYFQRWLR